MQYQSVIRLFEYCNVDCSRMDAARTKKILAAEFAIAPGGIISIDGFDYTKNDIFRELEGGDFAQRLEYHQLIWQHQSLLDCLERNTVDLKQVPGWEQLKYRGDFPQLAGFISPYFAVSFDKVMRKLFDPLDFKEAATWLKTLYLIDNAEDEHTALSGVRIFITDFERMLKNANDVTYLKIIPQLEKWFFRPWPLFINNLPDSFYSIKNELLSAMINFMVVIQRKNKGLCFKMSEKMIQIKGLDPDLKKIIDSNHHIFSRKPEPTTKERSGFASVLAVLLPIIIIVVRIASISNHSSNSRSTNDLFAEKKITIEFFIKQRILFQTIDTSEYRGYYNKETGVIANIPYYLIFEKNENKVPVTVNIINITSHSAKFYLLGSMGLLRYELTPGQCMQIKGDTNAVDVLFSNMGQSGVSFPPSPILISDKLNMTTHQANLSEYPSVQIIPAGQAVGNADFTMRFHTGMLSVQNISTDKFTFDGANWLR